MAAIEPIKLEWAPGLTKLGTVYQTPTGRLYDANLMRYAEGVWKPMKGWANGLTGTLSGNPRAAFAWKDDDLLPFAAFGSHSHLYAHDGTTLDDITPSGFAAGDANTSQWTLDNFGELLIACSDATESIYEWQPGGGGDATVVTNSPDALAVVTTDERFIVALGADGDPRRVAFCDGENRTAWTPASTNRAREILIQSPGTLMCGTKVASGTLLFTTHDIHFMRYIGLPDVYQIKRVGSECGIIGKHAFVSVDQTAYWMGLNAFWVWMGYAEPLQCSLQDDVFKNINQTHRGKVWCWHNSADGEVWFYYPRGAATECSHAAVYCYRGQPHWTNVELARNCGFPAGTFDWPVKVTSAGVIKKHEFDYAYDDAERFILTGPFEISNGGALLFIDEIIPDELTQGDCSVYFYVREYPTDPETTFGPYTNGDRIVIEAPGRAIRMEIRASDGVEDFRIGTYRAIVKEWSGY
jgi:hypothetical protein